MKIICGLGNPGRQYERHRHNIGFRVVDALSSKVGVRLDQSKFHGESGHGTVGQQKLLLLKPQTFMNVSGQSVAAACRFYKVPPDDLLVIHDELDLPFGRLQLKRGGGTGGHNGLRSIVADLGEDAFGRLRFGVDKPTGPGAKDRVAGYVLAPFSGEEEQTLDGLVERSVEMAVVWLRLGMEAAMNQLNRRGA